MQSNVQQIPATPGKKVQDIKAAKPRWTSESLLALAEETNNHGAHIPAYGEVEKRWKEVVEAMKSRGYSFSNFRTLQHRFERLLEEFRKKRSERATVSGVEDDDDDDPLQLLLEDMNDEVQDYQAEKVQKKTEEKNKEAALVAGGKQLRDKAAVQILNGEAVRVGGDAVELNNLRTPSPAMSMFGASDSGEKVSKRSREDKMLFDLMESERKKVELDNDARMEIHRAEMAMRKQELDVKLQEVEASRQQNQIMLTTLQNQMLQHQQAMELQMKQFELKLKKHEEDKKS